MDISNPFSLVLSVLVRFGWFCFGLVSFVFLIISNLVWPSTRNYLRFSCIWFCSVEVWFVCPDLFRFGLVYFVLLCSGLVKSTLFDFSLVKTDGTNKQKRIHDDM